MATHNQEKALQEALQNILDIEKERQLDYKLTLKHKALQNKPEDEENLSNEDGKSNGPKDLIEEIYVQKNFRCAICKQIPIAPVMNCDDCGTMYCGEQCLAKVQEMNDKEETKGSKKKAQYRRNKDGKLLCLNRKCKSNCLNAVPIGRLIRNIMYSFEFEHQTSGQVLAYQEMVNQLKKDFEQNQIYSCPFKCDSQKITALKKDDMKNHLATDCPNFSIECTNCFSKYQKKEFNDAKKHNCISNLKSLIAETQKSVVQLKEDAKENVHENRRLQMRFYELNTKLKQLQQKESRTGLLEDYYYGIKQQIEGSEAYQEDYKMPIKFPKGFYTIRDTQTGGDHKVDQPIVIDNKKKKKEVCENYTEREIVFKFKRKLFINRVHFDLSQARPHQVSLQNLFLQAFQEYEEIDTNQQQNNEQAGQNRNNNEDNGEGNGEGDGEEEDGSYMYIYLYAMVDGQERYINNCHIYNTELPKHDQEPKKIKQYRDDGAYLTDTYKFKFQVQYDKNREVFDKINIRNLQFFY